MGNNYAVLRIARPIIVWVVNARQHAQMLIGIGSEDTE